MKNTIYLLTIFLFAIRISVAQDTRLIPKADRAVYFDISPPLRDMIKLLPENYDGSWKETAVKNYFDLNGDLNQQAGKGFNDPGLQDHHGWLLSDTTIQNFEGMGNISGYVPPDTHGEAGLNHFFQTVNCSYSIYNKSGSKIMGPLANSSVWFGMPNNENSGDAIVIYDEQANRWFFSQFSLPNGSGTAPFYQMIAISQTPDPTGSWYRYQYEFADMPDYPKFGVWPDAYYMSANLFAGGAGWVGNGAYCFDRTAMLAGNPDALRVSFTLSPGAEGFISLLPSDCDGTFPAYGTPNYFTYIRTNDNQRLGVFEFQVDWGAPANSTFGNLTLLDVNPFGTLGGWGGGIPQKDSPQKLETLSDRLMYRLQYRKFNDYSSMVLNHSVDGGSGNAGIRWYELRNSGSAWSIYQQATYAPDIHSRWMGSIAQDTAGTIAMGYSVSSDSIYPGIRYTGRLITDPLNQMTIMEKTIINGGGSQMGNWSGRSRWGDYSGMSVDPSAPTTFWFTTEYYATTSASSWQTRIASFTFGNVFSSAASSSPSRICSTNADSSQLNAYGYGGSGTYTYVWTSIPAGFSSDLQSPKVRPQQTTRYIAAVNDGSQTRFDTAEVSIVLALEASAGNDTIVCWFVSPVPMYATATNYSKIAWGTGGDGYFSDASSLITNYFPGNNDITSGSVDLVLLALPVAPCASNSFSTKHVVLDPCTGIKEHPFNELSMVIQPNPAHGITLITVTGLQRAAVLTITDMEGRTVYTAKIDPAGKPSVIEQLDVSSYPKGMYLMKLVSEDKVSVTRLIVQ